MNPDIIAAIVAFLQGAMGESLQSASGYRQVYGDYAPQRNPDESQVVEPFAVVLDGSETYTFESQDPATGNWLHCFADGTAQVAFYALTFAEARALARTAVRVLSDTVVLLNAGDAPVLTVFAARSDPMRLLQAGIGQPTIFGRIVTFQYKQEFGV